MSQFNINIQQAGLVITAALALSIGLTGCGGASSVSMSQLKQDSATVSADLDAYLGLENQNELSIGQLQTFMTEGRAKLTRLRTSFDKWSYDLDHINRPTTTDRAYPLMLAYRSALGDWISEQERQADDSQSCLNAGALSQATLTCYQQLVSAHAAYAQAVSLRLNRSQQELNALGQ